MHHLVVQNGTTKCLPFPTVFRCLGNQSIQWKEDCMYVLYPCVCGGVYMCTCVCVCVCVCVWYVMVILCRISHSKCLSPFLPAGCTLRVRPAGPNITLRFPRLLVYIFICASVLIMCAIITSRTLLPCDLTFVDFGKAALCSYCE